MTIICAWCGEALGEKCSLCGGPTVLADADLGLYECDGRSTCPKRGKHWVRGEGGMTTTICDVCLAEVLDYSSPVRVA